jgi:hypothetical protein
VAEVVPVVASGGDAVRRRKLLALVGLAVVAGVAAFALWPQPNRITRENCARIRKGMSRAEVEAILGPPGDYTSGPMFVEGNAPTDDAYLYFTADKDPGAVWCGDAGFIVVLYYPSSGRALDPMFCRGERQPQGSLGNLLWRAERRWRRWFPSPCRFGISATARRIPRRGVSVRQSHSGNKRPIVFVPGRGPFLHEGMGYPLYHLRAS